MPKPPNVKPAPEADVGEDEVTLKYIEAWCFRNERPWIMTIQDRLTTLKIGLVANNDLKERAQHHAFYPLFTCSEFALHMAIATWSRKLGKPLDLRWLKRMCQLQVDARDLNLRLVHFEKETKREIVTNPGAIEHPPGWTYAGLAACTKCGRSTIARDIAGKPFHPHCGGRRV